MDGPYLVCHGHRTDLPESGGRLLAFTALHGGTVQRSQAAGTLWPAQDELRATRNLRSALWRLREAGIDTLQTDSYRIAMCPSTLVDVNELSRWFSRLIAGRPVAADLDASPLQLCTSELLPGYDADWVWLERERIRQRLLHGLEAMIQSLTAVCRHSEAVEAAEALVAAWPRRASAHRLRHDTYRAAGRDFKGRERCPRIAEARVRS